MSITNERFYEILSDINENHVKEARMPRTKAKKPAWIKWGAVAACLCLIIALSSVLLSPESPQEVPADDGDCAPHITLDGKTFYISSYLTASDELPPGFTYSGTAEVDGIKDCPYYLNPDVPEWVYVYHEVNTDGTLDESGTAVKTPPHGAYVRYVDERLRGKKLISYNDRLYISMWSADYYADTPDVSREYFNQMRMRFGVRIENEAPEGFISVGTAEFTGYDTIPSGALASNSEITEVFANPDNPDVVLASTRWYAAAAYHKGYNVYILYDGSLK